MCAPWRQAAWGSEWGEIGEQGLMGETDDVGAPSERLVNQVTPNARSDLGDLAEPYLRHIENKVAPNR